MSKLIHYVAVAQFEGKARFLFYSDEFAAESIGEALDIAQSQVNLAWERIAPYDPPKVVDVLAGTMRIHPEKLQ